VALFAVKKSGQFLVSKTPWFFALAKKRIFSRVNFGYWKIKTLDLVECVFATAAAWVVRASCECMRRPPRF
jgi:hypothetical protein